jgi:ECF transporter S component (folate family)
VGHSAEKGGVIFLSSTQKMVANAFLIALNIVATRLFSFMIPIGSVGALRLGFGPVPIILAGAFFGPLWGGLAGLAADLLGFVINPMGGPFLPQITAVAALTGVIPGLILGQKGNLQSKDFFRAIATTQIILSIIIMPWILYHTFGVPVVVNIPVRILTQLILIPSYTFLVNGLYRALTIYFGFGLTGPKMKEKPSP